MRSQQRDLVSEEKAILKPDPPLDSRSVRLVNRNDLAVFEAGQILA